MNIPYGHTTTYSHLAATANHSKAARAVGSALSKNPLPLIIPCHRVIKKNGKPGGFTAPGGTKTKQKLLNHEQIT
jgi:methylated-DNA-[protein]-cysteine S-methyltransferase